MTLPIFANTWLVCVVNRLRQQTRALVSIRRFLGHLVQSGALSSNPGKSVKELRRMPVVPKGLTTAEVRKILREIELRQDYKAGACIGLRRHLVYFIKKIRLRFSAPIKSALTGCGEHRTCPIRS